MDNSKINQTKKWIKIWQQAGDLLDDIKLKELRSPNYYSKNQPLLNEMLKYAFNHRTIRLDSGLIKQQQIFMKYHQKKS